jgi:sRNA-binding protein
VPPCDPEAKGRKARAKRQKYWAKLKGRAAPFLAVLSARWPEVFPEDPARCRPWAVDLIDGLRALFPEHSKGFLRSVLHLYSETQGYQAALAAGGPRYDLDGRPSGEVTEQQKAGAAEALRTLRENKGDRLPSE